MQLADGTPAAVGVRVMATTPSDLGNYAAGHTGVVTRLSAPYAVVRWDHSGEEHTSKCAKLNTNSMQLADGTPAAVGVRVVATTPSDFGNYAAGHTGVVTRLSAPYAVVRWDHSGEEHTSKCAKLHKNSMPEDVPPPSQRELEPETTGFGIPARIEVRGAGSEQVNLMYIRDGNCKGRPKWSAYSLPPEHAQHATSQRTIYRWKGRWYIVRWMTCEAGVGLLGSGAKKLSGARAADQRYRSVAEDRDLPPMDPAEWELVRGFSGESPCPTLTYRGPETAAEGGGEAAAGRAAVAPGRTFATSNFKHEYEFVVPIETAAQIIGEIPRFIITYLNVHGRTTEADTTLGQAFAKKLAEEAGAHAHGGGGNLLADVGHTAEVLWTSASKLLGIDGHRMEFCSLLNAAIRDDHPRLASSAATLTRGINKLCLEGRGMAALPFPADGITYRGGGFDDAHQDFFTPGKSYRVPGFVATSFSRARAQYFLGRSTAPAKIMWVVYVNPAGAADRAQRCKHVNLVTHRAPGVPDEQEYLFTAYSIFTVRAVTWGEGGAPHRIDIDAASDNNSAAEGGDGRWATPPGSEDLPLAPWY
jgi:hypothetical protein